jgi:hypothetical protein
MRVLIRRGCNKSLLLAAELARLCCLTLTEEDGSCYCGKRSIALLLSSRYYCEDGTSFLLLSRFAITCLRAYSAGAALLSSSYSGANLLYYLFAITCTPGVRLLFSKISSSLDAGNSITSFEGKTAESFLTS